MTVFLRSVSSCLDSAIATMVVHRFVGFVDVRPSEANQFQITETFELGNHHHPLHLQRTGTLEIKPAEVHGSQSAFFQQLQDCILNPCADKRARNCAWVQIFGCFLFGQRTARALHESCGPSPSPRLHRMIFSRVRSSLSLVATFPPATEANLKAFTTTFFKFPLLFPSPFLPPS